MEIFGKRSPNQFVLSPAQFKSVKAVVWGKRRVCDGISGQIVHLYWNKELPASFATLQGGQQASTALNKLLPLVEVEQEGPHGVGSCSNYRLHQHCVRLQLSAPSSAAGTHLQGPDLAHCRPRTKENGGWLAKNWLVGFINQKGTIVSDKVFVFRFSWCLPSETAKAQVVSN